MKTLKNDEEAVSPVIGVILMVAIVVILAAIIAAFVFGMVGSTTTSKNVGLTVSSNTSANPAGITILWQGGADINNLESIDVAGEVPISFHDYKTWDNNAAHPAVGELTDLGTGNVTGARVIITGSFTDGSSQVMFDKRF